MTIVEFELCEACADGTCGACGRNSHPDAGPGIKAFERVIRFQRCVECSRDVDEADPFCVCCGPNALGAGESAVPGIVTVTVRRKAIVQ